MKCPVCGGAELQHATRDMPYTYKSTTTLIPAVTGDFCPSCGEVVLDREQGDRYGDLVEAFQKQVNGSHVDPAFITRVRTKLKLGQREAGVLLGGGVNAFNRYEAGKSKPPVSLVLLLTILDHHPDLLAEVLPRPEGGSSSTRAPAPALRARS